MIPQQRTETRPCSLQVAAGSAALTQGARRTSGRCAECGSTRVTTLGMMLTDGTPVQFGSCRDCEHRQWSHEGEALTFTDVIARATRQKV